MKLLQYHNDTQESVYEKMLEAQGTERAKKAYKNRNKSEMPWIKKVLACKVSKVNKLGIKPPPTPEEIEERKEKHRKLNRERMRKIRASKLQVK